MNGADYYTELEKIQDTFGVREFHRFIPKSEFPEMFITLPDEHESIQLAPLFDLHIGSPQHDGELLKRHLGWLEETPNVFSFDGGDLIENITPANAYMGHTPMDPEEQIIEATRMLAPIQHKLMFKLPGNHEDRTRKNSGMSSGRRIADNLKIPYFSDYAFVTIKWRGNNFRLLAHHGAGSGTTPGAQRNSARKEIAWSKPDILWTGHVHQPMVDVVNIMDHDQKTGLAFQRDMLVVISPSYVKYFGGYAAKARYAPGTRGLGVIQLQEDGRIDASVHARGRRL